MPKKKPIILFLIASLLVYGLLIIDSANKESRKIELENKVVGFIEKHKEEGSLHINFSKDIGLSYDTAYVFPPYTSEKEMRKHLGAKTRDLKPYGIHYRDDISLLVFVKHNEIQNIVELPSKYKVFPSGNKLAPFSIPKTARITIMS